MAEKGADFYSVLGLGKECTSIELRTAYRKLAMQWHPDRCGVSDSLAEATTKFQEIQEAYSSLSDPNKRLMYDLGVEDDIDDNHKYGMDDFMDEMATMMREMEPSNKNAEESFEELQDMFAEMLLSDMKTSQNNTTKTSYSSPFSCYTDKESSFGYNGTRNQNNSNKTSHSSPFSHYTDKDSSFGFNRTKRDSTKTTFGKMGFSASNASFCFGSDDSWSYDSRNSTMKGGTAGRRKKGGRK